jgi:hypothetical protein
MQCSKCKNTNDETSKYCSQCGFELEAIKITGTDSGEVIWSRSVVLSFVGWLFVYALVAGKYAYGPYIVTFTAQLLTMLVIYVGIFGVACVGGLCYKLVGKKFPMKRIVNSTLIASVALGGFMIFGLQYSAR